MWKPSSKQLDGGLFMVSVPLRGLDMWKPLKRITHGSQISEVSVPLRGLDMWKPCQHPLNLFRVFGFSPLAGIRYVETDCFGVFGWQLSNVSVPLRGLDMWKLANCQSAIA